MDKMDDLLKLFQIVKEARDYTNLPGIQGLAMRKLLEAEAHAAEELAKLREKDAKEEAAAEAKRVAEEKKQREEEERANERGRRMAAPEMERRG